jgi:hypothetical protein
MRSGTLFPVVLAMAAAALVLEDRHSEIARAIPNYPGIRFSADGKLSITVFSDLHFGERESIFSLQSTVY